MQVLYEEDGEFKVVNNLGEFLFEIRADEETGVIDMYAGPTHDELAVFPTRVVELPDGFPVDGKAQGVAESPCLPLDVRPPDQWQRLRLRIVESSQVNIRLAVAGTQIALRNQPETV